MLSDSLTLFFFFSFPAGQTEGQTSPGQMVDEPIHPVNIPRREKDFQGMLEYKKEDELKLVKNLILGKTLSFPGGELHTVQNNSAKVCKGYVRAALKNTLWSHWGKKTNLMTFSQMKITESRGLSLLK